MKKAMKITPLDPSVGSDSVLSSTGVPASVKDMFVVRDFMSTIDLHNYSLLSKLPLIFKTPPIEFGKEYTTCSCEIIPTTPIISLIFK